MQDKPKPNQYEYDHVRLSWNGSRTDRPVLEFLRDGAVVASAQWRRIEIGEAVTLAASGTIDIDTSRDNTESWFVQ